MKISEVCARVHLTERAVRLYIREGLVQPGQRNGITVFDAEGIVRLEQIAAMRRADFSIDQIRRMLTSPSEIAAVVSEKKKQLTQRIDESQTLLSVLENIGSVEQLVEAIQSAEVPAAGPIRTSFDELRINEKKKHRHNGSTGEAQLLLSALSKVQHFGSFQQPVQGMKDVHLPAPDFVSTSFDEPRFDEAEERKSARRRKWIRAFAVAGAIVIVLFILFTHWLDNYIKQYDSELYPIEYWTQEQLQEIVEQREQEGNHSTILPDR